MTVTFKFTTEDEEQDLLLRPRANAAPVEEGKDEDDEADGVYDEPTQIDDAEATQTQDK